MDKPERVYFQYRSKPNAVAWYAITEEVGDELEAGFGQIRESYDIDKASGHQLDVIAAIVGTSRSLTRGIVLGVTQFALEADADDSQFGDEDAQFSAGEISEDAELDDQYLRKLILWQIGVNNSDATIEDILAVAHTAMPDNTLTVDDPEDMTFSFVFTDGGPSDIDALILGLEDVVPRPQGVLFSGYSVGGIFHSGYQP